MSVEHRIHPRYPVELAAEVDMRGELLMAATKNVSIGGVGLLSDQALPEGKTVSLTLFLTQDGIEDADEEPFEISAVIAWSTVQDAGQWLTGVRFGDLSPPQKSQLERFLSKLGE